MTSAEFRHALTRAGYSQRGFAQFVGANERTVRRWASGKQDIPPWVAVMFAHLPAAEPAERGPDDSDGAAYR